MSTGIAAGNTLEALAAVYLLRHYVGTRNPFSRAGDFVKFVLLGPIISTTFSAAIGNLSLCLGGAEAWGSFGALWIAWWLGDGVGALLVVPLLLSWVTTPAKGLNPRRLVEEGLVYLLNAFVCLTIYSELFIPRTASYPIGHLTIPLLLWAALRFGPRGASTAIAVLSAIAIWGTAHGVGPFAKADTNTNLLLLQAYIADMTITARVLAAIVKERKRAESKLRVNEAQLQLVTNRTPVMLTQCTRDLRYTFVNRAYAEMLGTTPDSSSADQ